MDRRSGRGRSPVPRAVLPVALSAVLGLCAIALLAWPAREGLFEAVAGGTARSPVAGAAGLVADKGLLALVAITASLVVLAWFRDRPRFGLLTAAGAGTLAAYAASEVIKLVVTEERPCRVVDVATVLACPVPGTGPGRATTRPLPARWPRRAWWLCPGSGRRSCRWRWPWQAPVSRQACTTCTTSPQVWPSAS
nr:hypothetical protein GCM10025730_42080 [Promicromonospora thailandica]